MTTPAINNDIEQRLADAKISFVTRRVSFNHAQQLILDRQPRAGDLVLARVGRIKRQTRVELRSGRRAHLYEGDELVLAYGSRYAADQFEAEVPNDLAPCQLVAAGGIAARVISKHGKIKAATEIIPMGLLGDAEGRILNLADYALPVLQSQHFRPRTIAVFGTSMNSGKTTMASDLVQGAQRAGLKVNAAKLTGTGSGPDIWKMLDAGASEMLDFTDQGYASTAGLALPTLLDISHVLISRLSKRETDLLVLEIADGLLQRETRALLNCPEFRDLIDGCLLASPDSIAAVRAVNQLQSLPLNVLGIGGVMSQSPLTSREATEACGIPYLTRSDLHQEGVINTLLAELSGSSPGKNGKSENIVAFGC